MYMYAQLNEESLCNGLSRLSGEVTADKMVLIEEYDTSIIGKKYEDGKWIEMPKVEVVEEPTEQEIIQAELLLNQVLMQEQLNSIDEVNAQILLNTMGGL